MRSGDANFRIGLRRPTPKWKASPPHQFQRIMQGVLFPALQKQLGPLSDKHQQLVLVLSLIQTEAMVASWSGGVGRPTKDRRDMARSFVAKAVFNMNTEPA